MSWSFICRHLLSALHILFKQLNNSTNKQSGTHRTKLGADEGKNFHPSGWQFTEEFGGFWLSHATLTRKDKVPFLSFLSRVKANETLFYSLFSCVYPRRNGCAFVGKDKQNDVNEDLHVPLPFSFSSRQISSRRLRFFVISNGREKVGHNVWVSGAHRFQQRFFFYFYCKRLNFLLCFSPSVRVGRRNNRIRYDHLFHFHFRPVFSCWQLTLENWAFLTLMTSFFTFLYNATWIELSQSARISKHKNKTTIPFSSFQWPSLMKKTPTKCWWKDEKKNLRSKC